MTHLALPTLALLPIVLATSSCASGSNATGGPTGGITSGGTSSVDSTFASACADKGAGAGRDAGGVAACAGGAVSGNEMGGTAAGAGANAGSNSCVNENPDIANAANIDLSVEYQTIRGFGGISVPGWIPDLTADQVDTAFGNGIGQIGLSILRVRIPYEEREFDAEVPTAQRAAALGATVFASPWTPPPSMKTNGNIVGGRLDPSAFDAYAEHLLRFRDHMEENGVPIYALSIQNEPDIEVTYESCFWNSNEIVEWLVTQGPRFGNTKLIAAESYWFDHAVTDPILNREAAAAQVDIIGGHIYGGGLADYPLARDKGKEVWMTEHYTESASSANLWPLALDVGKEIHDCMVANFSAYVWWYIRRFYGLITEDGNVSKRGYLLAQYAKYVRPLARRVAASSPWSNVLVSAYKSEGRVVVVAVNTDSTPQTITLNFRHGCIGTLSKITTSETKNLAEEGSLMSTGNRVSVVLDAESVTTLVGE